MTDNSEQHVKTASKVRISLINQDMTCEFQLPDKKSNFGQIGVNKLHILKRSFSSFEIQWRSQFWWSTDGVCQIERTSDVLFTNIHHCESSKI